MDAPFPANMMDEIRQFLSRECERLPGQNLYHEVFETAYFFPLQRKYELQKMIDMARRRNPKVVMEIGSDKGGGLYHWCKCIPTVKKVIACEIRGTPYAAEFYDAFPDLGLLFLPWDSQRQGMNRVIQRFLKDDLIDVLFIDGDKLKMEEDFDKYLPLMHPQGLVFIHDVSDREPKKAFERISRRGYHFSFIVDRSDWMEADQREMAGIPCANEHEGWLRYWKGRSCGVGVIDLAGRRA